jgi:hypothetical protein
VLEKEGEEEAQMDAVVKKKRKRNEYTHENLLKDLRLSEPRDFKNFLRLDATSFDELLKMITPRIEKRILLCEMLFLQASICQLHYVTLLLEILLKT